MKITKIHVDGFGKLKDFDISFDEGVNIVTGPNESGKTTLFLFVRSMLYGVDDRKKAGRKSVREKMRPWEEGVPFGGSMELQEKRKLFRIARDFSSASEPEIYEFSGSGWVAAPEGEKLLSDLTADMSEAAFVNTVSVSQLGAETGKSLSDEILSYASNMETTSNPGLSALKAIEYLSKKKRSLSLLLTPESARAYNIALGRIKAMEEELSSKENENHIPEARALSRKAGEYTRELEDAIAKKDEEISLLRAMFPDSGIDSLKDAVELQEESEATFSEYRKKKHEAPREKAFGIIFLLLGVCGIFAARCFPEKLSELCSGFSFPIEKTLAVEALAAGLIVLAVILLAMAHGAAKKRDQRKEKFAGLCVKHLGTGESSGELLDADKENLDTKIGEYKTYGEKLDLVRFEREELDTKLSKARETQNTRLLELDRELKTNDEVESGMRRLKELEREAAILGRKVAENEALRDDIDAIEIAADLIRELADKISHEAGIFVNKEAGRMIEGLTDGAYDSISLKGTNDIRLFGKDGMISVRDLSQGTMDQVYLALRLAAGRFIAGPCDPMPLLMDDSFAMYDDSRLRGALSFIAKNYHGQVIIMSCQLREEKILEEEGVPHRALALGG